MWDARHHFGEGWLPWALAAITISLSIALGGGTVQGLSSDALIQLASLPLLGVAAAMLADRPISSQALWALGIAGSIILLPLAQLIPLPPEIWTRLPGRSTVLDAYRQAGIQVTWWWPISLDPAATWRSFLTLLPPLAVFLGVMCMGLRSRRSLVLLLVGFGVASMLLGLLQLMQGPASPLRLHAITNTSGSVGFFANRNHYAALLYSVLPFAAAWTIATAYQQHKSRAFGLAIGASAMTALLLGIAMSQSRAGAALGLSALVLGIFLLGDARRTGARRPAFYTILAAGAFGLLLIIHYALPGLLSQFEASAVEDYRFEILGVGRAAAETFLPFGSGFGTFEAVYQMHDRPEALLGNYVNHAHNDWLELWIEAGWLAAPIAAAFVAWFGVASYRVWQTPPDQVEFIDVALSRAASISVGLLLLHSFVEYPLRTTSLATVFALCCALLIKPIQGAEGRLAERTTLRTRTSRSDGSAASRTRRSRRLHPAR